MNELLALLLPSNDAKTSTTIDHHSCFDGTSSTVEQAQATQAKLSGHFPSFLKQLLKSHLSGKFYLGLPKKFCDVHMPARDETIVLVDEDEKEYGMKYSVRKNRLGGGWRVFSVAHRLLEGDALLFHLVEPCKFRVYIMKAGKLTENDGSIAIHAHDLSNIRPISSVKIEDRTIETPGSAEPTRPVLTNSRETKRARAGEIEPDDFKLRIDGLALPDDLVTKYYQLCWSQKTLLHDRLIEGLSRQLAAAVIWEIVNLSDAIRSTDLGTPLHSLDSWERTLKAFEDLGMTVGFLRDRVRQLAGIKVEHQAMSSRIGDEVADLEWEDKKLCYEFQILARAPW